ncbi:unnamed protein product [Urochloa humidicola]
MYQRLVSTRCFGRKKMLECYIWVCTEHGGRKFSVANKRNEQRMVMKHNIVPLKQSLEREKFCYWSSGVEICISD